MKEKHSTPKIIACLLLLAFAIVSMVWLAEAFSKPENHRKSIEQLDEKKTTVMELTAATALASVAISAVPGDATSPIANQVAQLSSYLLVVTGVLMLEKFLLTFSGIAAFRLLIPLACAFGILYLFFRRGIFKGVAIRTATLGAVLVCAVPLSLWVSSAFEQAFRLSQTVEEAQQAIDDIENDSQDQDDEDSGTITDWFSDLGDAITNNVSGAVDSAEKALSNLIDAVAVLLISNCVIPVLVILMLVWIVKMMISIPMETGFKKATPQRVSAAEP